MTTKECYEKIGSNYESVLRGAGKALCLEVFKGSELCGIKRGSGGA